MHIDDVHNASHGGLFRKVMPNIITFSIGILTCIRISLHRHPMMDAVSTCEPTSSDIMTGLRIAVLDENLVLVNYDVAGGLTRLRRSNKTIQQVMNKRINCSDWEWFLVRITCVQLGWSDDAKKYLTQFTCDAC